MHVADVICWTPRHNQYTVYFLSMKTKRAVCPWLTSVVLRTGYKTVLTQPDISFPLSANRVKAFIVSVSISTQPQAELRFYCLLPWASSILIKKQDMFSKIIKIFSKEVGILVCSTKSQLNHWVTPPIYLDIDLFILSLQYKNLSSAFGGQLADLFYVLSVTKTAISFSPSI